MKQGLHGNAMNNNGIQTENYTKKRIKQQWNGM